VAGTSSYSPRGFLGRGHWGATDIRSSASSPSTPSRPSGYKSQRPRGVPGRREAWGTRGGAARDCLGALLELEPSEPYIGRRGCPIDHKVAQRLNRGAGERAASGPSSQLNFGRQRKTGAEARHRATEGTNAAQELLKASTRSRRRAAATRSAVGEIRDRQHRWAATANASGPSAAGNYKASSSPARGRSGRRRARRRTVFGCREHWATVDYREPCPRP
jgi:hypothetical protein